MQFHWIEYMSGDLQEAIDLLEGFWITTLITQNADNWEVWGGDQIMLTCDTQEEAHAFVLGMAINYVSLPEEAQEEIRKALSP